VRSVVKFDGFNLIKSFPLDDTINKVFMVNHLERISQL
jgi:hypothetical protein